MNAGELVSIRSMLTAAPPATSMHGEPPARSCASDLRNHRRDLDAGIWTNVANNKVSLRQNFDDHVCGQ
jgi:hypothetical protein